MVGPVAGLNPFLLFLSACTPLADDTGRDSEPGNQPPAAPTVSISPSLPMEMLDPLVCRIDEEGVDPEADPVTHTFAWSVTGEPWNGEASTTYQPGDTVPGSETRADQTWTCAVTPSDGSRVGEPGTSEVTITPFLVSAVDPYVEPVLTVTPQLMVPGEPLTIRYTGPLSSSEGLLIRHGWNGWVDLYDGLPYELETSEETTAVFYLEEDMVWVDGGWELTLDAPQDARSLHMVVSSQEGEIDDNSGREYHWSAVFPYVGPYLTWAEEDGATTGMVVSWETSMPCLGVVRFGEEELDRVAVGEEFDTLHRVRLDGLAPDSRVQYQVHDSTGQSSDTFAFRTAAQDTTKFSFVVASDMQFNGDRYQRWSEVADEIVASHPDSAFLFLPGDLTGDDTPGLWWRFFDGARALLASIPMVPAIGNHDTPTVYSHPDTRSFHRWFDLPYVDGTEDFYALSYGHVRLLALSTETPEDLQPGESQYLWVEQELLDTWDGGERRYAWVFAALHHPPYDVGGRFGHEVGLYRPVTALFDGQLDWVFAAHEHIYQRFHPLLQEGMIMASYGIGVEEGVGYIVTPAAGWKNLSEGLLDEASSESGQRDWVAWPALEPGDETTSVENGFLVVSLDGDGIKISSLGMGDSVSPTEPWLRDEVSYQR